MQRIKDLYKQLDISVSVWAVFVLALILRFWGIAYGLPLQLNIDEPSFVSGTLSLNDSLNPGRFDWPSLYFYVNAVFYFIYSLVKPFLTGLFGVGEDAWSPSAYFIISRSLSAILGSLTVIVVYLTSRKIFSHRVGVIAAIIVTVLPVHVYESHFAKIDIAHTFFIAIAVYYIWRIYKSGNRESYLWTGFWIGVVTSIKYNGFLLAISVLTAYFMRKYQENSHAFKKYFDKREFLYMLIAGAISIVVFYLGTPFALIDYNRFFSDERGIGAMWQFKNVGSVDWALYPAELFETFVTMFRSDMGFVLWILFSILMILFLFFNKRSREYVFLLLPTLIITFYISRLERSPSHYFLMLIPFYVPALANFIYEFYKYVKKSKYTKFVSLQLFVLAIMIPSFWNIAKTDYLLSREDTRQMAHTWVKSNLDENNDFLFIIGEEEELSVVEFKRNEVKVIEELDRDGIAHRPGPFYVLIAMEGLRQEELTEGERDPLIIKGDSTPILKDAELVFAATDENRLGPPIYIFKVNSVVPEPPKTTDE